MWLGTPDQIEALYVKNPSRNARKVLRSMKLPEYVMSPLQTSEYFERRDAIQAMCLAIEDWLIRPEEPKPAYGTGEKTKVPSARRRGIGLRRFVRSLARA